MFKPLLLAITSAGLLLAGCESKTEAEKPPSTQAQPAHTDASAVDQEWKPSTLSEQTIAKANAAVLEYNKCLTTETKAKAADRGDPRDITNVILKNCEGQLPAIKLAFDAENVPAVISERYMRKTRSHGIQAVLRTVMGVHAERAGNEAEAAAQPPKK